MAKRGLEPDISLRRVKRAVLGRNHALTKSFCKFRLTLLLVVTLFQWSPTISLAEPSDKLDKIEALLNYEINEAKEQGRLLSEIRDHLENNGDRTLPILETLLDRVDALCRDVDALSRDNAQLRKQIQEQNRRIDGAQKTETADSNEPQ